MPETTENFHRIPVSKPKKNAKIRTIDITKGIKALYDFEHKTIVTYIFDVDQFTMKQAKEWVKKHKGSPSHASLVEIDYVIARRGELNAAVREDVLAKLGE